MTARPTALSRGLPKALAVTLLALAGSAAATTAIGQEIPGRARLYPANFSWFQNAASYAAADMETPRANLVIFGGNEYVCSPAGFGQHSYCYR